MELEKREVCHSGLCEEVAEIMFNVMTSLVCLSCHFLITR